MEYLLPWKASSFTSVHLENLLTAPDLVWSVQPPVLPSIHLPWHQGGKQTLAISFLHFLLIFVI